jgi:endo-1,4-beta-xylanase
LLIYIRAAALGSSGSLDDAARKAGLHYFGTAVDNGDIGNGNYLNVLKDQFGQLTPANSMKVCGQFTIDHNQPLIAL